MPSTSTELSPMLATLGPPPTGNWAFEMKWDGQRTLATVADGQCRLTSRTGNDITRSFPELPHELTTATGGRDCIVDGEIVSPWTPAAGRPSPGCSAACTSTVPPRNYASSFRS